MLRREFLACGVGLLGNLPGVASGPPSTSTASGAQTAFLPTAPAIASNASRSLTLSGSVVPSRLSQRFPALEGALPRVTLAKLPTPIYHAARLGVRLGLPQLDVKRDDLISPAYGGSKVRKLEYFLGAAAAEGRTELVTGGSLGSHHALATAIHGVRHGFGVELLLLPEPESQEVREVLAASAAHARSVRRVPSARALPQVWRRSMAELGDRGYSIPLGGSSPLGAVGSVEAALELEEQVDRGELAAPDFIYVALGTMSTAVGLALGLQLTHLPTKVVAVRASSATTPAPNLCEELFQRTVAMLISADPSFPRLVFDPNRFAINGRHLGGGYALPTREGRTMKALASELGSLSLELTYTAKAMAALASDARAIGARPVLFWNTHAGPAPQRRAAGSRRPKRYGSSGMSSTTARPAVPRFDCDTCTSGIYASRTP